MKKASLFCLALLCGAISMNLFAQPAGTRIAPREDDHFQREKVVSRVDLENKLNQPLVNATSPDLYTNTGFENNQGIIATLISGMKAGKYIGYDPQDLNKTFTYEDLIARSRDMNGEDEEEWGIGDENYDFTDIEGDNDPEENPFFEENGNTNPEIDLAPLESVMEIIEDRIFDKNRSDEVFDLQYIRLVWVDPGETLPDQNYVCFKYEDIMDVLDDSRWANKFNDAEDRSLREILELRLFESYAVNVRGRGVRSLEEAAFREQQLIEFEHHLWSY